MKKINTHKLPDRVIRIIRGEKEWAKPTNKIFHVTSLLMSAYARKLFVENYDKIICDYSDELLTTQGNALHSRYEKFLGSDWQCELPLTEKIDGLTVVGTIDGYNEKRELVLDIKQTAVWVPFYKIDDYAAQTNDYAWMLRKQGKKVSRIEMDIWYRNWKLKEVKWGKDYPKIPYEMLPIPVWDFEKQEQFIRDQLHYHTTCEDTCTREDRWQRYAVMKNKNKTSSKNCDTKKQAEQWIAAYIASVVTKGKVCKDKFQIVDTEPTNCLYYCKARTVCPFALELKK